MSDDRHIRIYIYRQTHERLMQVQWRMRERKGGRQVSFDEVIAEMLDKLAEREEQGA